MLMHKHVSWLFLFLVQGKVELELEVVTEAEELERPAGKAREEPNMNPFLPEPKWGTAGA